MTVSLVLLLLLALEGRNVAVTQTVPGETPLTTSLPRVLQSNVTIDGSSPIVIDQRNNPAQNVELDDRMSIRPSISHNEKLAQKSENDEQKRSHAIGNNKRTVVSTEGPESVLVSNILLNTVGDKLQTAINEESLDSARKSAMISPQTRFVVPRTFKNVDKISNNNEKLQVQKLVELKSVGETMTNDSLRSTSVSPTTIVYYKSFIDKYELNTPKFQNTLQRRELLTSGTTNQMDYSSTITSDCCTEDLISKSEHEPYKSFSTTTDKVYVDEEVAMSSTKNKEQETTARINLPKVVSVTSQYVDIYGTTRPSVFTANYTEDYTESMSSDVPISVSVGSDADVSGSGTAAATPVADANQWPVKHAAIVEGDLVLGGLMMVHEREDTVTCGPVMPQGGIQALEAMLFTLDKINEDPFFLPNITLGAHILDDCDKDTYGLEMAVDFIKGRLL